MDNLIPDRRVRLTIYHVIAAGLTVAAVWGIIEADTAEEVSKAVASLIGAGTVELAAANTPAEKDKGVAVRAPAETGEVDEGENTDDEPIDVEPVDVEDDSGKL